MRKQTNHFILQGIAFGILYLMLISPCLSQTYFTTFGLRFGNSTYRTVGLTVQQRVLKKLTIEGILQSDFKYNTTLSVLAEGHYSLLARRLNLYYGAGPSWGWEQSRTEDPVTREIITTYGNKTLGVDLIGGIELTLARFNVSLDYKPNVNLVGRDPWLTSQVGISARYVIVKNSTVKKIKRKSKRKKRKKERVKNRENQGRRGEVALEKIKAP